MTAATGGSPRRDTGDTEHVPVVVVGAGPVGLLLAGELCLHGAPVVVLDRLGAPTGESRASTLHARTMEILDSRGLLDGLDPPSGGTGGHFGGVAMDLALPGPYPGQWKLPQPRTEQLLGRRARDLGARLRRGWTVRGVADRGGHVTLTVATAAGERRLRADWLLACDGERSTVRELIGAPFPGQPARHELLRADISGIDVPNRRFHRLPGGLAIAARQADGVTRLMVHERGRAPGAVPPEFADVAAVWRRLTGEDIGGGTPLWVNAFTDASRQLAHYRHGRVLFAGDAAHVQLPSGGQALNLGLHDAANLGWKLAATVRGWAPPGLLDTYHDERHQVGARVLANIRAQTRLLLGGPEVEPVRALLAELIEAGPARARLAGMVSGLDVRYPVGPDDHPLLGARLPHEHLRTPGGPVTTTELLRPGGGLLLELRAGDGPALGPLAAPWAGRVRVVGARPVPTGPLAAAGAVLVRPDGHVVGVGTDRDGLLRALDRWFGPPSAAPRRGGTPA